MTKDEILSRLLSDISDEFDKGVGSFFYDVTKPASEEFEAAYARLEEILKNGFALTASGEYLDFKAAEQGITRKSGVASQVVVTITGTPGSVISVGDKVASDNLIFSAIENKEISESGTAEVTVICDTVGTVGNIPTGSINRFPVTLSGIVKLVIPQSLNVLFAIFVTLLGIFMLVRPVHSPKARSSMEFNPSGSSTFFRPEH